MHEYVRLHVVHPRIVKELFLGGGDFLRKNDQGLMPLDLVADHEARYIENLIRKNEKEYQAATVLQRRWRTKIQNRTLMPSIPPFEHPLLNKPVREPVSNPLQSDKLQAWIEQHNLADREVAKEVADSIQHISHRHFLFGLKMAIKKLNQYLLSLPLEERNYL